MDLAISFCGSPKCDFDQKPQIAISTRNVWSDSVTKPGIAISVEGQTILTHTLVQQLPPLPLPRLPLPPLPPPLLTAGRSLQLRPVVDLTAPIPWDSVVKTGIANLCPLKDHWIGYPPLT